jgi:hypothetical protein
VQDVKRVAIHNLERKMVQANVATAVKRHAFLRVLDLPERHDAISVGYEGRRIALVLADNLPAEAFAKEAPSAFEIFHGKPDVVDADRQWGIILHG